MFMVVLFASVDINNANEEELMTLKGIGSSKANAIMEYRKNNCFKSIDDILKVKGIGKKIIEKNLDNLTISECN